MAYDTVIIGSGIAGLSASIYTRRYNLNTLIIQGESPGGAALSAGLIENYPGFKEIQGPDLINKVEDQAVSLGTKIIDGLVESVKRHGKCYTVITKDESYLAKTVILATGSTRRRLGLPNEEDLIGKGVNYCATCDAPLFRDKAVGIVGGGDAGLKAAIILNQYAKAIYLITLEKTLHGEAVNQTRLKETKAQIIYDTKVEELIEDGGRLIGVRLSKPNQGKKILPLQGLFIEIGSIPDTACFKSLRVQKNTAGNVVVDDMMATNMAGLFAAGDVTNVFGNFKQMITAAAQGAAAAHGVHEYLNHHRIVCQ